MSDDARIPTYVWVEAEMRRLSILGVGVYVRAKGDRMGGIVLQKIADMKGQSRLLLQQRNLNGVLVWMNALADEVIPECDADAYIERAIARDPDLWVIEIEDPSFSARISSP